jgi:threonine dehydrogenase-like Zn-dependent dehydrogenase
MQALTLSSDGVTRSAQLQEVPIPKVTPNSALVRVTMSGICGTDLQLLAGYYLTGESLISGHEFVGYVDKVHENGDSSLVGKRVVADINVTCSYFGIQPLCSMCSRNRKNHCSNRKVIGIKGWNGAHATYVLVPVDNLVFVPDETPDEFAVLAEPLAAALEILEQVNVKPSWNCLVIGLGRLGQLILRVLAMTGAKVTGIYKHEIQKLAASNESARLIDLQEFEEKTLQKEFEDKFDFVVECSGSSNGLGMAIDFVAPKGIILCKSTFAGSASFNASKLVVKEVALQGSRCGPIDAAVRVSNHSLVNLSALTKQIINLGDIVEGFKLAASSDCLKVLIRHS